MAVTNHERVGKALGLLKAGLAPAKKRPSQEARATAKRVMPAAQGRLFGDTDTGGEA